MDFIGDLFVDLFVAATRFIYLFWGLVNALSL